MTLYNKGRDFLIRFPKLLGVSAIIFNKTIAFNKIKSKGQNNIIKGLNKCILRQTQIVINGTGNIIDIKEMSFFEKSSIHIVGNNNKIIIGEKVVMKKGDLYIEDDNNLITIGDGTSIMGYTHIAVTESKKVIIGKDCLFSSDVVIRTGDSHSIVDNDGYRINQSNDVIIGNHVWIGNKTTLLKGSVVKSNSIVGTGSIVTKAFNKKNVVLVGNPAKIIKENINWLKERI